MEKTKKAKELEVSLETLQKSIAKYQEKNSKEMEKTINALEDKISKLEEQVKNEKIEYPEMGVASKASVDDVSIKYFQMLARKDKAGIQKLCLETAKDVEAEKKALVGGSNLVPAPVRAQIYEVATKYGVLRRNASVFQMTSDTLKLPTAGNDLTLTDTSAGVAYTSKTVTVSSATLTAVKSTGYIDLEEETLADANISVLNYIYEVFGRAVGKYEDTKGFTDGTAGILATGTAYTLGASDDAFEDLDFTDLSAIPVTLSEGHRDGAKFYMHATILAMLQQKQDSNNNFIFSPPGADMPGRIWGWPYETSEVLPDTGDSAADTEFMVFGNLKNYAMGVRTPLNLSLLDQVVATNGKVRVLAMQRLAFAMMNATDVLVVTTHA